MGGRRKAAIGLAAGCSIILQSCTGELSTLDPAGPAADAIATLFWVMIAVAAVFTFALAALFLLALRQRRAKRGDQRPALPSRVWTHWLGLAMPLCVLTILLAATILIGERQFVRDENLPVVRAQAARWGWQFAAIGDDGTPGESLPQLHLVAGQPTIIELVSDDVIHSFWVPRLAGKMDVVPGKVNRHLLQADKPGRYAGQCAEYCGVGHDAMRFEVIVRAAETQP